MSKTFLFQTIQFIQTVPIQLIQFSVSTDFVYTVKCQNSSIYNNLVSISKTVQFETIQFCISTQFKCKYSLIVKNISILSYSV